MDVDFPQKILRHQKSKDFRSLLNLYSGKIIFGGKKAKTPKFYNFTFAQKGTDPKSLLSIFVHFDLFCCVVALPQQVSEIQLSIVLTHWRPSQKKVKYSHHRLIAADFEREHSCIAFLELSHHCKSVKLWSSWREIPNYRMRFKNVPIWWKF